MGLIDFILNVAGLLLWFNWRSVSDPFARGLPATLSGTVRRAQPVKVQRWHYLATLAVMLFLRAVCYRELGPAVNWVPKIDLYFVVLSFKGASFLPTQLFSLLSFLQVFVIFYFWLLVLAAINRHAAGTDPLQKMISLQLGRLARWPALAQMTIPLVAGSLMWVLFHPALIYTGAITHVRSTWHLAAQSLLVGGAITFSLKFILPVFLALHLVASYVYLGRSPLWDFVALTSRNLLAPLNRPGLRAGKIDFTPVTGIILILLLLQFLPNLVLIYLDRYNLTVWPQ